MAGAIVPLIAGLAPDIIKLITGLVHRAAPIAETSGPATGPVKFAQVFGEVMESLNAAAVAGAIPKSLPSDDVVKLIIQAVVTSMQLGGLLSPGAPGPAGAQSITLKAGQTVTISA